MTGREIGGEKELEQKGGVCDGGGVRRDISEAKAGAWEGGAGRQVEHAAHIKALACVSHRYTAAGGGAHCYLLVKLVPVYSQPALQMADKSTHKYVLKPPPCIQWWKKYSDILLK